MQFTILQENLLKATQEVLRFIPSKTPLPILSCFLLEAKKGKISFSATDLQTGIKEMVDGKVTQEGVVALPARVFVEYISSLPAGTIEIEEKEAELHVTAGKASAVFQISSPKDFPQFPKKEGEDVVLPREAFLSIIEKGGLASGMDETRPVFSSLYIEGKDGTLFGVSTDGYRLARKEVKTKGWKYDGILLPTKAVREVARIIDRLHMENVGISLSARLGQVFFTAGDLFCSVRLTEASFPDYDAIIPKEFAVQITFQREEFLSALKTALVFGKESSGIIKLSIQKDSLLITASSNAVGKNETQVDIEKITGENAEIAFNGKYLQDLLSAVTGETVWFGMNEPLKPGMFKIEGEEGFVYIVMPFRMQGES